MKKLYRIKKSNIDKRGLCAASNIKKGTKIIFPLYSRNQCPNKGNAVIEREGLFFFVMNKTTGYLKCH